MVFASDQPTAKDISKELADKCELEWHEYIPLSTIAFYYEFCYSRDNLNLNLKRKFDNPAIEPSTCVKRLVDIIRVLEENNWDFMLSLM
ncbi:MAG TPA: hypothetical protein VJ810_23555 [Blastocatellia bacterium]|nr:hypothetical protein [Blastocatellia bacterium]